MGPWTGKKGGKRDPAPPASIFSQPCPLPFPGLELKVLGPPGAGGGQRLRKNIWQPNPHPLAPVNGREDGLATLETLRDLW